MDANESREEEAQMSETREPETAASTPDTAPSASTDQEAMVKRIAALEAELGKERAAATDYLQRWQRAQADLSNVRRRADQEREQHQKLYRAQGLAILLPALDTLERAFATLPATLRGYSWIDGVALVQIQIDSALRNAGVTPIGVEVGAEFDPRWHEAIGEVESAEIPIGRVAVVIQRGYTLDDLLLRPTLVQLSRGAPEAGANEAVDTAGGPGP
jgi:molecular chaperone GrpE